MVPKSPKASKASKALSLKHKTTSPDSVVCVLTSKIHLGFWIGFKMSHNLIKWFLPVFRTILSGYESSENILNTKAGQLSF